LIIGPNDVMVLDTVELAFKLPLLDAVGVHLLVAAVPIFVELINHERGVAVHHEAFNAELYGYTETM
jgi:hypothetical protein